MVFDVISINTNKEIYLELLETLLSIIDNNENEEEEDIKKLVILSSKHILFVMCIMHENLFGKERRNLRDREGRNREGDVDVDREGGNRDREVKEGEVKRDLKIECEGKLVALILNILKVGKETNLIDLSTHSSLVTILRSFISKKTTFSSNFILKNDCLNSYENNTDVLKLHNFEFLNIIEKKPVFNKFDNSLDTKSKTVQLTGISDPLYVECNMTSSKYDCVLDYLVINQTSQMLTGIRFEYTSSPEISLNSGGSNNIGNSSNSSNSSSGNIFPSTLAGDSAITLKNQFTISESSDGFITGSIHFNFIESGIEKNFIQHLSEIRFYIKDFLFPLKTFGLNNKYISCQDENENICHEENNNFGKNFITFSEQWKLLIWENIYSVKGGVLGAAEGVDNLLQNHELLLEKLIKIVNGKLCDKKIIHDLKDSDLKDSHSNKKEQGHCNSFLVANVGCYTLKKNLILINFCMGTNSGIEIRIRSLEENIVKNISNILRDTIRSL